VPYKGEAAALNDLLGGQIQTAWAGAGAAKPFVVNGRLRALAVAAPMRSKALPDVPTFAEFGYPDVGTVSWFGVLLPAATSRPIVEKLSADINRVLAQNDVVTRLNDSGVEPAGTSPERFAEVLRVDIPKWQRLIKEAGITAD
jgi:tripartite-type tricarboxylate transporter receptor subunit TctC